MDILHWYVVLKVLPQNVLHKYIYLENGAWCVTACIIENMANYVAYLFFCMVAKSTAEHVDWQQCQSYIYVLDCHITTKGPKWRSYLECLPTIPFTYRMGLNDTWNKPSQTQREANYSLFVFHHNWLTLNVGHLHWTFSLSCNRPLLCNNIVGRDTREPMSLRSFCRGTAVWWW